VFDTQINEEKLSEIIKRWQVLSYAIGWYRSHNTNIQNELGMLQYPDDIAKKIGFVKTADFFEKNNVTDFIDRFKQYGSGITAEGHLNHILRILRK
jgi:cytolysin (calcineurin-like family phosphatase)